MPVSLNALRPATYLGKGKVDDTHEILVASEGLSRTAREVFGAAITAVPSA